MNRISCIFVIVLTLALPLSVRAQYYSVNIDYKTIGAMSEAYSAENATEMLHKENLQKVFESYKAAEVASAGIFASKYLDRKALTSTKLWDSEQENRYYTRIYNIVSRRIIPKTIQCARLMIQDPATAIYWGSYLLKTCQDVKSLCRQFESVVTNSKLSFSDITFVDISEQLAEAFDITQLGGTDWKEVFENMGDDMEESEDEEGVKSGLEKLISAGVGLAASGYASGLGSLMADGDSDGKYAEKASTILTYLQFAGSMYSAYQELTSAELQQVMADSTGSIFQSSDYDLSGWLTDYKDNSLGQYYTQRVYIYSRDYGNEELFLYEPPTDDDNVLYGAEWYRVDTTDPQYYPTSAEQEAALANSESHAGWSRQRVNELNNAGTKYHYNISYYRNAYILSKKKSGQYGKSYAYTIKVSRWWDVREEVHEEVFDSYSMDWNTFMAQMNARLDGYNANGDNTEIHNADELNEYINSHPTESSTNYYIGYDARRYYQASDERKVAGASSATFTVTCHDGGSLGKGSVTYKCGSCGKIPNAHTRECSMSTTLTSTEPVETEQLKKNIASLQSEASSVQKRLDELNGDNSEILRQMSKAEPKEYANLQKQYNDNKGKITELQNQLDGLNSQISDYQKALRSAEKSEREQTDEYDRIPSIMQNMKNGYGISWTDDGSWSGNTFTRGGTVGSISGKVTFKATLSMARKPKYFLGIKIHRAIVQIDWELTSEWADSNVEDIIELDPNKSDEENAEVVNARLGEIKQEYPNCDVDVEYTKTPGIEEEDDDDTFHLLWASDRLEIAKGIEARLARIYTDLVTIEKFLHYRHTYRQWISDLLPKLNADRDRKLSIAEQCRRRWMRLGGSQDPSYREEEEEEESDEEE